MHYGTIDYAYDEDILEASVTLTLMGNDSATEDVVFIIDTGLTEEMALAQDVIDRLGLPLDGDSGDIELILADGASAAFNVYIARILWHGRARRVAVVNTEGVSLIGMELLRGSNLNIDTVPGGLVTITELTDSSAR